MDNEAIQLLLHRQIEDVNQRLADGIQTERFFAFPFQDPATRG